MMADVLEFGVERYAEQQGRAATRKESFDVHPIIGLGRISRDNVKVFCTRVLACRS
jgi:hypothetical protein